MEKIIEAKDVYFSYQSEDEEVVEPINVLNGVSLDIYKGEFVAILGHNGSGKSTIAKHFNGILVPQSGTVTINGMDTKDEEKLFDIRQTVGMVFQNPDNQIVATIVEEDVAFALENLGVPPAEIRERVDEALKTVKMYEYKDHAPHRLSGGQKQRVAIAGVIAMRPECIVLDEPTAMLDPNGRQEVLKTIKKLNKKFGITIVLITHYMEEAAQADRIIVMDNGNVVLEDNPKKVFSQVEKLKSIGLDVPQVTELCYQLQQNGLDIGTEIIDEDECVDALISLLSKK
jgi:energy-coupling factor transport system ATP-binding protein